MRPLVLAFLCLAALPACGTEVTLPPDTGGSGEPTDTGDTFSSTDTEVGEDTTADAATSCPADPFASPACDTEGARCEMGQECCCGVCHPSLVCNCSSGQWACYNTDACMIPSCEGAPCTSDADCARGLPPGASTIACIGGTCTAAAPAENCIDLPKEACDTHSASPCQWVEPSGCPDSTLPSLGAAGCFPAIDCTAGSPCPAGTICEPQLQVAPRCMWQEPLCDACSEVRSLCVPRGI